MMITTPMCGRSLALQKACTEGLRAVYLLKAAVRDPAAAAVCADADLRALGEAAFRLQQPTARQLIDQRNRHEATAERALDFLTFSY
jgi:hypothetical protein